MPTHYCYCNCNVQEYNQPLLAQKPCGAVTEEGKRTCPFADRPIQEVLRLPSSVTLPPTFALNKMTSIPNRNDKKYRQRRQCATFSSGEGFRNVRRFSHNQAFLQNNNRLPLLPDRGKPCPYDLFSEVYANPKWESRIGFYSRNMRWNTCSGLFLRKKGTSCPCGQEVCHAWN